MAVGNKPIENYVDIVKANQGLYTKKDAKFGGNVTVQGTLSANLGSLNITATDANALTVGVNGTTNPTLVVNTSDAASVNGLQILSGNGGSTVKLSTISANTNDGMQLLPKGTGTLTLGQTGNTQITAAVLVSANDGLRVTTNASNRFLVGPNGTTNPSFTVDCSTSSAATGLQVKSAAAGAGIAVSAISSGTNENLTINSKGSGTILVGNTSTGQVSLGRGSLKPALLSSTTASLGTTQNSTPTAAQLVGGIVTQTSSTGAGTATLDTGTNISAAIPGATVGDTFQCIFANLGGGQTITITSATGATVIGNGAVPTGKNAAMTFVNTGSNAWNVYVNISG